VLVDFWAPWCGPCRQLTPVLEKAVRAAKGAVKLVKLNIDDHPQIPGQMGVQSIPAVFAFAGVLAIGAWMRRVAALPTEAPRAPVVHQPLIAPRPESPPAPAPGTFRDWSGVLGFGGRASAGGAPAPGGRADRPTGTASLAGGGYHTDGFL
jgi:putative thioredoxin